jgi:hypothetical protein
MFVNIILEQFFGRHIRALAENYYGYIKKEEFSKLNSKYENLLTKLKSAEDYEDKYHQLSTEHSDLVSQYQESNQKYKNIEAQFNILKINNKSLKSKVISDNQEIKDIFVSSISETLKFKLVTPQNFNFQFPVNEIHSVLTNDKLLNLEFNNLVSGFKNIRGELYEQLERKVEYKKQSELDEKELRDKVSARQKLFVELEINNIVREVTESFWFLKQKSDMFPETFSALEETSSKDNGSHENRSTSIYKIKANHHIYIITFVDTRVHTYLPDGDVWDNYKETYSVKDESGNILSEFKWSYKYDYCKSRERFSHYDVNSFKLGEWVDDLIQLKSLIKTLKNQKDPKKEAEKKANYINNLKSQFDL